MDGIFGTYREHAVSRRSTSIANVSRFVEISMGNARGRMWVFSSASVRCGMVNDCAASCALIIVFRRSWLRAYRVDVGLACTVQKKINHENTKKNKNENKGTCIFDLFFNVRVFICVIFHVCFIYSIRWPSNGYVRKRRFADSVVFFFFFYFGITLLLDKDGIIVRNYRFLGEIIRA